MKNFTDQEKQEIREHFDYFDTDQSGEIEVEEFIKLLRVIAPESSQEEAIKGFEIIDSDNNGHVDFDEFLEWWSLNWNVFC